MNINKFIEESARTMSDSWHPENIKTETFHGIIGVAGEAGELLDAAKKAVFYNHELDKENLREEIGDIMWYIAAIIRSEGWDIESILQENIDKLRKRYPESFSSELARERFDKK